MAAGRQALSVRWAGGQTDPRRSVRWAQPAGRLPFHVRSGLGGGMQELLLLGRQFRRLLSALEPGDVTLAAISRAPWPLIARFKERMGWSFPWASSVGSDFNFDYGVSFTPEQLAAGEVF